VIALLVDGPANGQILRDLPGDTWIISGWKLSEHQFGLFGEDLEQVQPRTFPARYVRTAKGDGESATFQFEVPRMFL
jgi:hypothetical protein